MKATEPTDRIATIEAIFAEAVDAAWEAEREQLESENARLTAELEEARGELERWKSGEAMVGEECTLRQIADWVFYWHLSDDGKRLELCEQQGDTIPTNEVVNRYTGPTTAPLRPTESGEGEEGEPAAEPVDTAERPEWLAKGVRPS